MKSIPVSQNFNLKTSSLNLTLDGIKLDQSYNICQAKNEISWRALPNEMATC